MSIAAIVILMFVMFVLPVAVLYSNRKKTGITDKSHSSTVDSASPQAINTEDSQHLIQAQDMDFSSSEQTLKEFGIYHPITVLESNDEDKTLMPISSSVLLGVVPPIPKIDFNQITRRECRFLGKGVFDVCGHKLIDPFIYVSDKNKSADDVFAVNLNHTQHLIMESGNPEETITQLVYTSFGSAPLFFFTPIQTDYYLTWLEKYYTLSRIPAHCYHRWISGVYKRAIIDRKDCVDVCKKMLMFTLRYHCGYYLDEGRLDILKYVTAIANNVDTDKLSKKDKQEFRDLLDRVIEPIPFYYFKSGWKWDPAYLYDKLTGSSQMTLFKSCLVWLAKHDDYRFDFRIDIDGHQEHRLNQYSCLLFAMFKVCEAIKNHETLFYSPKPKSLVLVDQDSFMNYFPNLKYSYFEYDYGMPFTEKELREHAISFFEFSSHGRNVAKLFKSNEWNISDIDGVARNFFNLPEFFQQNYGHLVKPHIIQMEDNLFSGIIGKIQTRYELVNNLKIMHFVDDYRIERYFNSKTKYKLWVEFGPKWNSNSSFTCLSETPIGDMIMPEEARRIFNENKSVKRTLKYKKITDRALSPEQEKTLTDINQFYDNALIEPLPSMAIAGKKIPPVFEVHSRSIKGNILAENQIYTYGCWDNAVNRASILDNNALTRVFICAKWSLNTRDYKVVWDNVKPIKGQSLTASGITRRMNKVAQEENSIKADPTEEPRHSRPLHYPFPDYFTYDEHWAKPNIDWNSSI